MNTEDLKKKADNLGVTPEVYLYLRRSNRKIRYFTYDLKTEKIIIVGKNVTIMPERESSFDHRKEQGHDFSTGDDSIEDIVIQIVLRERLRDVLSLLEPGERRLINELFYSNDGEGKTIREAAKDLKMPATTFYRKTEAVLKKMRNLFDIEK